MSNKTYIGKGKSVGTFGSVRVSIKLSDAEKSAFEVINKSGSYDYWVTKSYILLGDIYFRQKDYFNAKATFQSIVDNSIVPEFKKEAQEKLNRVIDEEGKNSKVGNN